MNKVVSPAGGGARRAGVEQPTDCETTVRPLYPPPAGESKKQTMTTNNNNYNKNLQPFASKLRHNMTKAETCLWKYALRASSMGIPFRRERPIGRFIADFVCFPLKLVIEVDGVTHLYEEVQLKDVQKDKELGEMGFEVLRFSDDVVLNNINFVVGVIRDKIEELKKIHPRPTGTPASGGYPYQTINP